MPSAQNAIAIAHVMFEDLGSLEPVLKEAGYSIGTVDACTADFGTARPPALND